MITAIIPFRDWSSERLERCVCYLRRLPSISEILLVDFGSVEALDALPGTRAVRVAADRWCLSEANNIGIAEARNDIVLKIDADVQLLVENETLLDLAESIHAGRASLIVLQPTDFTLEDGQRRKKRMRASWGEGCGNLFNRADVIEIGGFDTRYFDYGGEDNDLCQRLRRYGKTVDYYQSDKVLHERHPYSDARIRGRFTEAHKKTLLADQSIFRRKPFRYSDYESPGTFGPAITVAIATKDRPNRNNHLKHCLQGLAAQSVQDFEVRICDNGSPEKARLKQAALRKAFPTLDIHLHHLDDASIPSARNLLTEKAQGFYIAVHDDDDYSLPTRLEDQLECMAREAGAHGCHSSWIEFDEVTGGLTSYLGQERDIDHLLRRNGKVTLHGTGFYRRDVMKRARYDESLSLSSDHQLHIRMTLAGFQVPHTKQFHCMRRLHNASVSATGPEIQRDVSGQTNAAYKYFVGAPYLGSIRAMKDEGVWAAGFPTIREMLSYLPAEFGAFRVDLSLEAALSLGFDPLFGAEKDSARERFGDFEFHPAFKGYGYETKLVVRSSLPLTAGETLTHLPAFREVRGVDIVSEAELSHHRQPVGLEALRVEKGQRRILSRRFEDMPQALGALPEAVLSAGLGEVGFFAVNAPVEGVHVLLGTFENPADLEDALAAANGGTTGDFMAVGNMGNRGGFHGA